MLPSLLQGVCNLLLIDALRDLSLSLDVHRISVPEIGLLLPRVPRVTNYVIDNLVSKVDGGLISCTHRPRIVRADLLALLRGITEGLQR